MKDCCLKSPKQQKNFLLGILYGLLPHTFCLAFIILSLIGAGSATLIVKKFLIIPHFFAYLIAISFAFAILTAALYLRKNNCFCRAGFKKRWGYLLTLLLATVTVNLLLFYLIFPLAANWPAGKAVNPDKSRLAFAEVQIPCSGHAPLIISEVKKLAGVNTVTFKLPSTFEISYDAMVTSPEKIAELEIFKTFKLKFKKT